MRKDASGNNVFGVVVQVVSNNDIANEYGYAWVWAAWKNGELGELTAPGKYNKSQLQ